jgi:lysophospholipase L1-like esterase
MATDAAAVKRQHRRWWFRVAAVISGLLPFVILEAACRLAGWGSQDLHIDPFVGFAKQTPLFERSADATTMQVSKSRRRFFKHDAFAINKPVGEFRIFVLGGSTVQGSPFSIETSFPEFLSLSLKSIGPDQQWKVVNCGGVSYASYRLVPILDECLQYEPDLIIFCEGHNEFLENVSYARQKQVSRFLAPVYSVASRLQSFRAVQSLFSSDDSPNADDRRPILKAEVSTQLDQENGLAAYHRDDDHAKMVAEHFRLNLTRICRLCRERNVPLLMIRPPANLADCPPFKSEFSEDLSENQRDTIAELLRQSRRFSSEQRRDEARTSLLEAVRLDDRYALSWYELGQLQRIRGEDEDALRSFQRAVDEDICPLRMTLSLSDIMNTVTREEDVPVLDAHELLSRLSPQKLPGDYLLVDHVHPSFRGHEEIAMAIVHWMQDAGLAPLPDAVQWESAARNACRLRVQSMDDTYFLQGRRQLEILKRWAAGRSQEPEFAPD